MAEIIRLTSEEITTLHAQEKIIEAGLNTTQSVVQALALIREQRLYRQDYKSFNDYCRERWGMGANYAHKLISTRDVQEIVPVANERQARELKTLDDAEKVEVLEQTIDEVGGVENVTAKALSDAVKRYKREKDPKNIGPDPEAFANMINAIATMRKSWNELTATDAAAHADTAFVTSLIGQISMSVKGAVPAGACPECKGKGCGFCGGHGWVSRSMKHAWEAAQGNVETVSIVSDQ